MLFASKEFVGDVGVWQLEQGPWVEHLVWSLLPPTLDNVGSESHWAQLTQTSHGR